MGRASRRKAARRTPGTMARAINVLRAAVGPREILVRGSTQLEGNISSALLALVETEVPYGAPLGDYRAALTFLAIAWNISLLSGSEQAQAIEEATATIKEKDADIRPMAAGIVARMIAQKQLLFPHDRRAIVSWDVELRGGKAHITAAALATSP